MALDHGWVDSHPEFFIRGTSADLERAPCDWVKMPSGLILAHGRDPNYSGWIDTLQLNYFEPALQEAMLGELISIATRADGVRCDMAMLLEPEVFERTWCRVPGYEAHRALPFWERAIQKVRSEHPTFTFMAEVYWNYEHQLQLLGFDYTYDKVLYDRLIDQSGREVRHHLYAEMAFQERSARFLENHDEPRIASVLPFEVHRAAAAITFFVPGLRFFHQGQFDGYKIRIPVHLRRGPSEQTNEEIQAFYDCLLPLIHDRAALEGRWFLLECTPAWAGNNSNDDFVCQLIRGESHDLLVAVNYAPHQAQCFVQLPGDLLKGTDIAFEDRLSDAKYTRSSHDLDARGLYLDVPKWHVHIFELKRY